MRIAFLQNQHYRDFGPMKRFERLTLPAIRVVLLGGAFLLAVPALADPATPAGDTQPSAATAPAAAAPTSQTPASPAAPTNSTPASPAPGAAASASPTPTSPTPAQPAAKPQPGQVDESSASYVSGYSDGCASSNLRYARQAHVKPGRDANLYDSDTDYHAGWDHGYRKCEDKFSPGALPVMGNSIIM
jgi:hypothetical protein